ncbi:uncharacterized protein LOC121859688 [Homarus americanus]|uniref:Uncharacterized protein n=1 Tax=Homarus americanus TaxID=6706 RepID=A0A8J5TDY0_HOMAM|nr:uncharacterized protein LOC121859688 [Homarus americanus]KAG7174121.1 hypothetical protein Hamer_G020512 [Homarus americanus]
MARKTMAEVRGLVLGWGPKGGEDAPFIQRLWPAVLTGAGAGNGLTVNANMLETLLAGCARDCLNSRKRRDELVEAFTPMLEASSDPAKAAAALIDATLEYHNRHLDSNGGVCKLGKFHNVLYVTVSVAVEQNVRDSDAVTRLLQALHHCEGGLDRLVAPAVLGPKVSHILSSWRGDTDTPEQARHRLQFFVDHARTTCLVLPQPGRLPVPLIDAPLPTLQGASPLYVAVQATDEDAVLLLLQNGATPVLSGQFCPFLLALRRLSAHAQATLSQRPPCSCPGHPCPCYFQHPIVYPQEALSVLHLLLRAIGARQVAWDAEVLHPRVLYDGILGGPPSLRHWARYSVRKALKRAWKLPHGTSDLGQPQRLISYLNLYLD